MTERLIALLLLVTLLAGCDQSERSFAGFTYGGGGNTYSAEPALLTEGSEELRLRAGVAGDPVRLELTWPARSALRQEVQLAGAVVVVEGGQAELESGHVVLQAEEGRVAHGSFDFAAKSEDGRSMKVVGSFTAHRE